jgi:hypothetical protein
MRIDKTPEGVECPAVFHLPPSESCALDWVFEASFRNRGFRLPIGDRKLRILTAATWGRSMQAVHARGESSAGDMDRAVHPIYFGGGLGAIEK